jgi:NAD(P)-dependent dehydrogenase (short-subunit alcohol dehydrogenase family)
MADSGDDGAPAGRPLDGAVTVVTGGNSGVGLHTAMGLAAMGATTVLACRNPEKAPAAAAEVRRHSGSDLVATVTLDLADLASVQRCATELQDRYERLDVLVNNAGGILAPRRETAQGVEMTFGVNHLGPFALTCLLVDRLQASAPARIVNVASFAHWGAVRGLRFDDLQSTRRYRPFDVYARSKLANILFTRELARRLAGTGVTANAVHPGAVRSGFGMEGDLPGFMGLGNRLVRPFEIGPDAGARTSIHVATAPELASVTGGYFVRSRPGRPAPWATDDDAARRLWDESRRLLSDAGFEVPDVTPAPAR